MPLTSIYYSYFYRRRKVFFALVAPFVGRQGRRCNPPDTIKGNREPFFLGPYCTVYVTKRIVIIMIHLRRKRKKYTNEEFTVTFTSFQPPNIGNNGITWLPKLKCGRKCRKTYGKCSPVNNLKPERIWCAKNLVLLRLIIWIVQTRVVKINLQIIY